MIQRLTVHESILDRYRDNIDRIYLSTQVDAPDASIVIVTYGTPPGELSSTIRSIHDERAEVIVIDNHPSTIENPFLGQNVTYVAMKGNAGVCVARNLGAILSRSNVVIFLDDDAVPGDGFVEAHLQEHLNPSVLAVRGRCLPKSHNFPNRLAFHYDLGSERKPSPIDLEGNSSFKRAELLACGGFNEELPPSGGWEGVDVSYRLVLDSGDSASVIYSPYPIIFHDYKSNSFQLLSKLLRHRKNLGRMSQGDSDLSSFFKQYERERNPLKKLIKALRVYQRP